MRSVSLVTCGGAWVSIAGAKGLQGDPGEQKCGSQGTIFGGSEQFFMHSSKKRKCAADTVFAMFSAWSLCAMEPNLDQKSWSAASFFRESCQEVLHEDVLVAKV